MQVQKCFVYSKNLSRILKNKSIEGIKSISTLDNKDVEHHSKFKDTWWDENGTHSLLHLYNPFRIQLVKEGLANTGFKIRNQCLPLEGIKVADIGCGGGIFTESLARIGAHVTGLDASSELLDIANQHIKLDPNISERVNYIHTIIEEFSVKNEGLYDIVVASEILEHVNNQDIFLKECVKILKPGGSIFVTTINKTTFSWLGAIVIAEHILKIIPLHTHDWNKFITPHEVQRILYNYNCETKLINGIMYNPMTNKLFWSVDTSINYVLHAVKGNKTSK